jgi:hypothetical protein
LPLIVTALTEFDAPECNLVALTCSVCGLLPACGVTAVRAATEEVKMKEEMLGVFAV